MLSGCDWRVGLVQAGKTKDEHERMQRHLFDHGRIMFDQFTFADLRNTSEKVQSLGSILCHDFVDQLTDDSFSGMVFVREVALATSLAWLLRCRLNQRVEVASGTSSMTEQSRNEAFYRFRTGQSRLLVCTTCAEEGVDVAACGIVVRFSAFSTTRSHVQGDERLMVVTHNSGL